VSGAKSSTAIATIAIARGYCGRFAPSPTGPLHFGSLIAALASFLDARANGGRWLVRIEDLDPPREVPGAADDILRTLEAYELHWDGSVLKQSERSDSYDAALEQLRAAGLAYPCSCSRTEVESAVYPGTCRNGPKHSEPPHAIRFRAASEPVVFEDAIQGVVSLSVADDCGDFVVRRKDGLYAYQLAVTVDDAAQGITHVVRGADLLTSTPRQILLQGALGLEAHTYAHVPLAVDRFGRKLSKSSTAPALSLQGSSFGAGITGTLWQALAFLGQAPPPAMRSGSISELKEWAVRHWQRTAVDGIRTQTVATAN
jgi:glutamyl-Q tRNA(Asp) synthetase